MISPLVIYRVHSVCERQLCKLPTLYQQQRALLQAWTVVVAMGEGSGWGSALLRRRCVTSLLNVLWNKQVIGVIVSKMNNERTVSEDAVMLEPVCGLQQEGAEGVGGCERTVGNNLHSFSM